MATLRLNSVECLRQQEQKGDEIYFSIWAVGTRDWDGYHDRTNTIKDMDKGEVFRMTDTFGFSRELDLSLYEDDFIGDDFLGVHTISATPWAGHLDFSGGNASYRLWYEVIA